MKNWCIIDTNTNLVVNIISGDSESIEKLRINNNKYKYIETFDEKYDENNNLISNPRKISAGVGYKYDEEQDAFIPKQEYESWTFNRKTWCWEPPIKVPSDDMQCTDDECKCKEWNEEKQQWDNLKREQNV